MELNYDDFLKKKIKEIDSSLKCQCVDMFDLIGSVRDRFSSPYISNSLADADVINELWSTLLRVFLYSNEYGNKFDSIITMSEIFLYSKRVGVKLNCNELERWRKEHDETNSTEEILECIDDMLLN